MGAWPDFGLKLSNAFIFEQGFKVAWVGWQFDAGFSGGYIQDS